MKQSKEEKLSKYPSTDLFKVIDTIGVLHPYCIGAKHVAHASDKFCGRLGEEAIRDGEKKGIKCETKGCALSYDQHELALLIEINSDKDIEELYKDGGLLQTYLLEIKDRCESDGYAGFTFIKKSE